jgi:hypothetical protein
MANGYYFLQIAGSVLVLYALSYSLVRLGKITIAGHRKLWNLILLVTFLVTGISGLLLAAMLDLGWRFSTSIDFTFWHVEFGIAMTVVALFHMLWHGAYFKSYLKSL